MNLKQVKEQGKQKEKRNRFRVIWIKSVVRSGRGKYIKIFVRNSGIILKR